MICWVGSNLRIVGRSKLWDLCSRGLVECDGSRRRWCRWYQDLGRRYSWEDQRTFVSACWRQGQFQLLLFINRPACSIVASANAAGWDSSVCLCHAGWPSSSDECLDRRNLVMTVLTLLCSVVRCTSRSTEVLFVGSSLQLHRTPTPFSLMILCTQTSN